MVEVKLTRNDSPSNLKLQAVKLLKEITGLGLKEAKDIADTADGGSAIFKLNEMVTYREYGSYGSSDSRDITTNWIKDITTNWINCIDKFEEFGYKLERNNERELKLKRVLYSDYNTLINHMLKDMSNWESILTNDEKLNNSFSECKNIAIDRIFEKYHEYLNSDNSKNMNFYQIYNEIKKLNASESKPLEMKFLKFNEEFGEMVAEYIKYKGYSNKEFIKENLVEEMADTLQVLMSIFSQIETELNIPFSTILTTIQTKNIKWSNQIETISRKND
jgi:NTP pyrophosphatase (non-canonical NTP hydrolase)